MEAADDISLAAIAILATKIVFSSAVNLILSQLSVIGFMSIQIGVNLIYPAIVQAFFG